MSLLLEKPQILDLSTESKFQTYKFAIESNKVPRTEPKKGSPRNPGGKPATAPKETAKPRSFIPTPGQNYPLPNVPPAQPDREIIGSGKPVENKPTNPEIPPYGPNTQVPPAQI